MNVVDSATPGAVSAEPFAAAYRVRFDEAGPDGRLRASGLLRYAQDVAWQHSEALGFDRAWYAARDLAWVVRAVDLRIRDSIPMGANLTVTTEVLGYRKVWARRRSEILLGGERASTVDTDWVLIDGRGRLTRLPEIFAELFPAQVATFDLGRVTLAAPPPDAGRAAIDVRPQELDPMGHVNNSVYLDWLDEAAATLGGPPPPPVRYRLEYAASAELGDRLDAMTWRDGEAISQRLVRAHDGAVLVRARVDPDVSEVAG